MAEVQETATQRVVRSLEALGIEARVVEFAAGTRTSAEAAQAIGCEVAQIAKSIVFRAKESDRAVLVIASGANRIDERRVSALIGEPIGKADAGFVRQRTGFVIGGVAPVGHVGDVVLLVDPDLLAMDPLWAAAGTPNSVFRVAANDLARLPGARIAAVKQE